MAKIVFIMDTEEGHILPSFALAQQLKQRGHQVTYVSILDNAPLVKDHGFSFFPIMENIYPRGFKQKYKENNTPPDVKRLQKWNLNDKEIDHIDEIMKVSFAAFLKGLEADLFVISIFLKTDFLVLYYKFNIRPVIFTPFLRAHGRNLASDCLEYISTLPIEEAGRLIEHFNGLNISFTSLEQLVQPLNSFCELIVCPQELDIGPKTKAGNVNYIGPSIRAGNGADDLYKLLHIPAHKKIVFASMGSQAIRHDNICNLFFEKMIQVFGYPELESLHLVLSTGREFDAQKLPPASANVSIVKWISQIDILKIASLVITHGGLGSVKECIYYGVPMIVFPLGYDQPLNAKRVVHHQLGLAGNIETITRDALKTYILEALQNRQIEENMRRMQTIFREKEEAREGVHIIDRLLTGYK